LRTVRVDALEAGHIGREGKLAELLGFVDDDLVDPDLADREKIVFARLQGLVFCFQFLLPAFDALA